MRIGRMLLLLVAGSKLYGSWAHRRRLLQVPKARSLPRKLEASTIKVHLPQLQLVEAVAVV